MRIEVIGDDKHDKDIRHNAGDRKQDKKKQEVRRAFDTEKVW